jgi:hypothetical protein
MLVEPGPTRPPFRRHRVLLVAGAAVVVVAGVLAVVALRAGDPVPTIPSMAAPTSAGSGAAVERPTSDVPSAPVGAPTSADAGAHAAEVLLAALTAQTIRYTFDAGPGRLMLDSGGHYTLRPVVGGGGAIGFARHGAGYAVRFPARCHAAAPEQCPRAILESTRRDLFNPGTRPIRFGAKVLMTSADTGPGANVIQKGFSVGGGSQYKLQVDGRFARPSCVLADGRAIYRLVGPASIADGRWHTVTCTRIGGRMSINIDGRAISRRIPAGLSISNTEPLRIGGKSAGPYNDQFAGRIDDVFVTLY